MSLQLLYNKIKDRRIVYHESLFLTLLKTWTYIYQQKVIFRNTELLSLSIHETESWNWNTRSMTRQLTRPAYGQP